MRVSVCDDEKDAIDYLVNLLDKNEEIEVVETFAEQEALLAAVQKGLKVDIVFMDIDWKDKMNGISLSNQLLKMCPETQIIYVTGYNDRFSQHIFLEESNLCGYLVKPVQKELLWAMIERAKRCMYIKPEILLLNQRGVVQSVLIKDVLYLESKGHHVLIHTKNEMYQIYEKLEECKKNLPMQFNQCHKSYIVNMDYVVYIDKNEVWLKDNVKINISKSRYKEFRESYFNYIARNM